MLFITEATCVEELLEIHHDISNTSIECFDIMEEKSVIITTNIF